MARRRRAYCAGKAVVDGACTRCYRPVRTTVQGLPYKHYAKAPTDRSDPTHGKRILETYGITGEEYEAILKAQGGVCYICEQPPRSKRLAVDHDHDKTGRESVRGLLCRRCNHRLLGSAHDATAILKRAISYLENPPARVVLDG
jgi:hypothetical protein